MPTRSLLTRYFSRTPLLSTPLLTLVLGTVLGLAVVLSGCDSLGPEIDAEPDPTPRFEAITDGGFHDPDFRLERPVGPVEGPERIATDNKGTGPQANEAPHPPAAFVSVRTPEGTHRYAYRSFRLGFPEAMVRQSGGRTHPVRYRLYDETGEVLRVLNARVPDAPGADSLLLARVSVSTPAAARGTDETPRTFCDKIYYEVIWLPELGRYGLTTVCEASREQDTVSEEDPASGGGDDWGGWSGSSGGEDDIGSYGGGGGCTSCEPGSGTSEPGEEEETAVWGKAINIGKKILQAAKRGEDLLDARTWKNMLQSEWADAAQAGYDVQAALNGDVVALISVLDYIAGQTVGFSFVDMLQGLKLGDRLGLSWYDDVVDYIGLSKHFDAFARAVPDFVLDTSKLLNAIDNLDTLEEVGKARLLKYDSNGRPIYKMYNGTAQTVMDNFARKWGRPTGQRRLDHGNVTMRLCDSTGGSDRWTIQLNRGGSISKFRFEKLK
jgi:hypothetical protein